MTAALDDLLLHVKSSPKLIRTTQENYEYEQILNQSRKIITYQVPFFLVDSFGFVICVLKSFIHNDAFELLKYGSST